jgi:hypothetical protein
MAKNPGARGEGRPRKDGTKSRRSSRTTAYPPKLEDIGITKDQSSKWQRLALLVDQATFEKALVQAREKNGELTNSALLREIKEQKQLLIDEGCEFYKDSGRKLRWVGIFGDRRIKRTLRRALRWKVLPYPKRQQVSDVTLEVPQPAEFGLPIPHPRHQENVRPA